MALFSIVVPIYNVEFYMKQCIDSILEQTFTDFELILVNDGSTDNSGKLCDEYLKKDKRIKVKHQSNGGASKARNSGLRMAKGDYVYFVDSDDYLANNTVFEKIQKKISDKKADIIKIKQIAFRDQSDDFYKVYKYCDISIINGLNGVEAMLKLCETKQMVISVYSYFIKREILVDNEIFFIEGVYSEDIDWIPRVFMEANLIFTLDEFVYYRRQDRPGQVTYKSNLKRDLDCAQIIDNWFKRKNNLLELNENENFIYFWDYLANIYSGLIANQYFYSGSQAKKRLNALAKYAYIIEYLIDGKYSNVRVFHRLFGFEVFVKVISNIKKIYRTLKLNKLTTKNFF